MGSWHATSPNSLISYTYAPTLRVRGPQAGEQKLADWSDKVKADDFAAWLRPQRGQCGLKAKPTREWSGVN